MMPTRSRLALGVLISVAGFIYLLGFAPLDPPESRLQPPGTVVLDASGHILYRDIRSGLRIPVGLEEVAPVVVQATVAAEDQRYWSHPGVDPIAMVRALLRWQEAPSGASTITQQLARRLYLQDYAGPVWLRKAREALLALQLEARYSKQKLLELYLNDVYYGQGAYGIEAAARVYFGVAARDLDLARAAFLAGLPQLPGAFDPVANPGLVLARQTYVLARLAATGGISSQQEQQARREPLEFPPDEPALHAPHFIQYVLEELERLRPELSPGVCPLTPPAVEGHHGHHHHVQPAQLSRSCSGTPGGLVIDTTLDLALQREAERSVRARLEDLREHEAGNAAVVVLEPLTGEILAMVGNADFWDAARAGQVNVALQPRQPGSALKPFLYAAAFERGYTAASPLLDVPTAFQTPEGPYAPMNYDRRFHGVVPLRVALASSYNVPAVRVLEELGVDAFLEMGHRVGLRTLRNAQAFGLALTLGGGEVTLLDMATAYGALAGGGLLSEPAAVARVRDTAGRVLYEAPAPAPHRVLAPEHAYLLADILSDPVARQPGFGDAPALETPFRAAVKTGTTTGSRDNWAVGFTGNRMVGVWVGNADGRPMENVSGVDGAGPIWRDVALAAVSTAGAPWLQRPATLVERTVCTPTGLLPGPHCPSPMRELFVQGTEPRETERVYGQDSQGLFVRHLSVEALPWGLDAGVSQASTGPEKITPTLMVVQPAQGSVLYHSPELPYQEAVFRAAAPLEAEALEFLVDGALIGTTNGEDPRVVWQLTPGRHRLEVVARLPLGARLQAAVSFEVRER